MHDCYTCFCSVAALVIYIYRIIDVFAWLSYVYLVHVHDSRWLINFVALGGTAGGNIISVADSATAGGIIISVALINTCFSMSINSANN